MYAQVLALAVLVQLYGVGQAASLDHVQDSISYQPLRADGPANDGRSDPLVLEHFTWTYSNSITSLTVCTMEPFVVDTQTFKQVTLLTLIDGEEKSCEGEFDVAVNNCATFTEEKCSFIISSGDVTYTLVVDVAGLLSKDINKTGTASFTMTVEAATLTCGTTKFIRAKGTNVVYTLPCEATGVVDVCYKTGDLVTEPFCFTATGSVPPELTLCLQGDNHHDHTADGVLTITQLAYTPAGSATFSLTHVTSASTAFEAIVLKDQVQGQSFSVTPDADSGTFTLIDFTGSSALYEVCTILPVADNLQTAHSSITDLDVQAEESGSLLQFRFTNANPDMMYVAKLDNDPPEVTPPSVNIDCTGVTLDRICYGFLDKSAVYTFLTIEYLAGDGTTSNKIAIPNPGFPVL